MARNELRPAVVPCTLGDGSIPQSGDSQVVKPAIAILGGGPTALEAALYARALGYPVTVRGHRGRRRWVAGVDPGEPGAAFRAG